MRRRRRPAQELRAAIDRLPLDVRHAVLEGIKRQRIIAGAHVDGTGGVCPMVAADVRWLRASASSVQRAQAAARAWDRYAQATGACHPASKRQVLALRAMLEASILEQTPQPAVTERPAPQPITEHPAPQPIAEQEHRPERVAVHRAPADEQPAARPDPAARPSLAPRPRPDTGERDRTSELRHSDGWSWLRLFHNYDDYEEALRVLSEMEHREEITTAGAR